MSLKKELDKMRFDKRLTGWHLRRGKLKKEELQSHLQNLPDCADNVYNEEDDDLDNPGEPPEATPSSNGSDFGSQGTM